MNVASSDVIAISTPSGSDLRNSSTAARTPFEISMVLAWAAG